MPDFADFTRLHPDIEMEILSSGLRNHADLRGLSGGAEGIRTVMLLAVQVIH
jgi:hypothetical protein